jgi:hypothetical protein
MEAKWPFFLLTFGLLFGLGLTIAGLERSSVMNNWSSRRCDLAVMAASVFFKPADDPRSSGQFATDNFDFCMKSFVDKFMTLLMTPVNTLFGKQANIAKTSVDTLNTVRSIATTLMNTFMEYIDSYYKKFNASVYEISRVIQYLRMAFRRANGMVMSMLYSGISMFRGLLNTVQFVIKVILIICSIMIAIIIILIFVLFPFIPMILAVLGAIVTTVMASTMIISGSVADEASGDMSGFCFSENTQLLVKRNDKKTLIIVKDIKIGDELEDGGKITAIILMNGTGVQLYNINDIIVSGSHLVKGIDGNWKCVADDERAKPVVNTSHILYCFNTTTNNIPIFSPMLQESIIFRDWEEISDNDKEGQKMWTYTILKMLNNDKNYNIWKDAIKSDSNLPLIGSKIKIKTAHGYKLVSEITIGDMIVDRMGKEQKVLGLVSSKIEGINEDGNNGKWHTELYELNDNIWIKGLANYEKGVESAIGMTIITETGELVIFDKVEGKDKIIRDFTEIGYKEIHKTYSMVISRLRFLDRLSKA